MPLPIDEQLSHLKSFAVGRGRLVVQMFAALTGILLALGIAGIGDRLIDCLAAAGAGVTTFGIRKTRRLAERAWAAYDAGISERLEVEIIIETWAEGETLKGALTARDGTRWQMRFAKPVGWVPAEGRETANVFFGPGDVPALIIFADGILYPESDPRRAP